MASTIQFVEDEIVDVVDVVIERRQNSPVIVSAAVTFQEIWIQIVDDTFKVCGSFEPTRCLRTVVVSDGAFQRDSRRTFWQ